MALINVTDVKVLDNPAAFTSPFQFEVTFECYPPGLQSELEWKLIYVGSADDEKLDQELDSVLVGPIAIGKNKFIFSAPPPQYQMIPDKDIMEVTVILLTGLYRDKEFIRIGYYVNNEYPTEEQQLKEQWEQYKQQEQQQQIAAIQQQQQQQEQKETKIPEQLQASSSSSTSSSSSSLSSSSIPRPRIDPTRLQRNILSSAPRVTRFQIPWDTESKEELFQMTEADQQKAQQEEQGGNKQPEVDDNKQILMQDGAKDKTDDANGNGVDDEEDEDDEEAEEDQNVDDADVDLDDEEEDGNEDEDEGAEEGEEEGIEEIDESEPQAHPNKYQRIEEPTSH